MNSMYDQADKLPYLSVKKCPNCEQLVQKDINVCPSCKYDFIAQEVIDENKEPEKEQEEAAVTKTNQDDNQEEIEEKVNNNPGIKQSFCTFCGFRLSEGQKFCGKCGSKVDLNFEKHTCPNCHEQIEASLSFCPYCGTKQTKDEEQEEKTTQEQTSELDNKTQTTSTSTSFTKMVENELEENNQQVDEQNKKAKKKANPQRVKKIVFASIQLFITLVILAVFLFVPLVTKDPFIKTIIPIIKKESTEQFMNGYKLIQTFMSPATRTVLLQNANGDIFMSGVTEKVCDIIKITVEDQQRLTVAYVVVTIVYGAVAFGLVVQFFASFISIFLKRPLEGKVLVFAMIVDLFGIAIVYPTHFFGKFKGYDTWLIYVFALTFLYWFVIKIAFLKENKNRPKKEKKSKYSDADLLD